MCVRAYMGYMGDGEVGGEVRAEQRARGVRVREGGGFWREVDDNYSVGNPAGIQRSE